jgi:hypothetical protein
MQGEGRKGSEWDEKSICSTGEEGESGMSGHSTAQCRRDWKDE